MKTFFDEDVSVTLLVFYSRLIKWVVHGIWSSVFSLLLLWTQRFAKVATPSCFAGD